MDKKLEDISDGIWEVMKFLFSFFIALLNATLTIVLLTGSFISFILLYKLFPEVFVIFVNALNPVVDLLIALFKAIYWAGLISFIIYVIVVSVRCFIHLDKKSKKRVEKKREKFLDDLADKMNKRLKKK